MAKNGNKIPKWEDVLKEITIETDPKKLQDKGIRDNFVMFLKTDEAQKQALEDLLGAYPAKTNYLKEYGVDNRVYSIGTVETILTLGSENMLFEILKSKTGTVFSYNVSISFHPKEHTLHESQLIPIRNAVIDISQKVMELNIPFMTYSLISEYKPNAKK